MVTQVMATDFISVSVLVLDGTLIYSPQLFIYSVCLPRGPFTFSPPWNALDLVVSQNNRMSEASQGH